MLQYAILRSKDTILRFFIRIYKDIFMDNQRFCESFTFNEYKKVEYSHMNNMHGVQFNYLAKMKKGHAHLVSIDTEISVSEGDFFFIPLGCRYHSYWYGEPDIVFDSLAFTYFPADISTVRLQKLYPDEQTKRLYSYFETDKTVNPHSVAVLYEVLDVLFRDAERAEQTRSALFLNKAVQYMRDNTDFTVKDIAAACNMSESVFYSAFKNASGITPIMMKHRLQAEQAVLLLRTTDYSVEAICSMMNFSSPAYFRKILRREYGKTPKEIRRDYGI